MNRCTAFAAALDDVALGTAPSSAFAAHLATCVDCATQLERRRVLAGRIDRALAATVRVEPAPGLAERIVNRLSQRRRQRRSAVWFGVPATLALAAGILIVISVFGGSRAAVHATDIAALDAWRSPTASLLVSRGSVLGTPFTLRSFHDGPGHARS